MRFNKNLIQYCGLHLTYFKNDIDYFKNDIDSKNMIYTAILMQKSKPKPLEKKDIVDTKNSKSHIKVQKSV